MSDERLRRWRLALGEPPDASRLGGMSDRDQRLSAALTALYGEGGDGGQGRRGGLGTSAPRVARWLGDIRELFPTPVVQVIQRDAIDRHGLKQLLAEPEMLATVEADVSLVADLVSLGSVMPDASKAIAREVVRKVVEEVMKRLASATREAVRGAIRKQRRTNRPRAADIDWDRTIRKNLRTWQPDTRTLVPERLVGHLRGSRRAEEIVLLVDQSGSMAPSVVYASIFAAVLASIPSLRTQLVCFDTRVVDLTAELHDPVEVLFGVQLGGGTDIDKAVAYVEPRITAPNRTTLVLITDLYEGGDAESLVARAAALVARGVNVVVLLALSDEGRPAYDAGNAAAFAGLGCPVFACTPDRFPDLLATALSRGDVHQWAAKHDIPVIRADEMPARRAPALAPGPGAAASADSSWRPAPRPRGG